MRILTEVETEEQAEARDLSRAIAKEWANLLADKIHPYPQYVQASIVMTTIAHIAAFSIGKMFRHPDDGVLALMQMINANIDLNKDSDEAEEAKKWIH